MLELMARGGRPQRILHAQEPPVEIVSKVFLGHAELPTYLERCLDKVDDTESDQVESNTLWGGFPYQSGDE